MKKIKRTYVDYELSKIIGSISIEEGCSKQKASKILAERYNMLGPEKKRKGGKFDFKF